MSTAGASETRPATSIPLDAGAFAPGALLADRYRIVALAGRGGMGQVYRADDLRLGQAVALKFLAPGLEADPVARERLLAEVRNARTVSHPNVCRVYDFGEIDGRTFLTMEYIDGEDLRSLLRRIGRLPPDKALDIARQLAAGLASAHDRGVLHRDLKPANVMIDGRGQVRITDFGLAADARPGAAPVDFAGTIAYMAPERFHGKPATVQSDLYSLGLVLYEACTGRPAFTATSVAEWQRAHSDSTPTSPSALVSEIQPAVERAILRCLEKDPSRRPGSAAQLAATLPGGDPLAAAIAAGETPSPELVAASGEEGTLPRAHAWSWLAACCIGFAILTLFGSWWSLAARVPLPHPQLQRERARQILRDLGYDGQPGRDSTWWMRENAEYLAYTWQTADRTKTLEAVAGHPSVLLFCYREAPVPLFSPSGRVTADEPAPIAAGDAYVELDTRGRLVLFRTVPSPRDGAAMLARTVDWTALVQAAGVTKAGLEAAVPEWGPAQPYDVRAAWDATLDGEEVRVEAAARHGKATYLRIIPPWMIQRASDSIVPARESTALRVFAATLSLAAVVFVAVLAARNLRLGRGDRRSAYRLAAFMFVTSTIGGALSRHWIMGTPRLDPLLDQAAEVSGGSPMTMQLVLTLGVSLFFAVEAWLSYVGFEPYVRRRWPHLLIASTRLLNGRWRDPLVGRSVLMGVFAATATIALVFGAFMVIRQMGWGTLTPALPPRGLDGLAAFVGHVTRLVGIQLSFAFMYLAVLVLGRLVLRRELAAWIAVNVTFCAFFAAWGRAFLGPNPAILATFALACGAGSVFVFWKYGLLALSVWLVVVSLLRDTPWAYSLTRWYAWPTWFATAMVAALALWGFRNVLGRQSAFPASGLDD